MKEETKLKISNALKKAHLEGRCKISPEKEQERRKKLSEYAKNNNLGGYIKGSGRGKCGYYKGYWCDSSYELAWVIYNLEHNITFERNTEKFPYIFSGNTHYWIPDFKYLDGTYIEIKGYNTEKTIEKINNFKYPLIVKYESDLQTEFDYVKHKYGKDFIKLYENYKRVKKCMNETCSNILSNKTKGKVCKSCIIKNAKSHKVPPKNKHKKINKFEPIHCNQCQKLLKISKEKSKTKMCQECYKKSTAKITYDIFVLLNQVKEQGFTKTAKLYNSSDNSVRKRLIKLLNITSEELKQIIKL